MDKSPLVDHDLSGFVIRGPTKGPRNVYLHTLCDFDLLHGVSLLVREKVNVEVHGDLAGGVFHQFFYRCGVGTHGNQLAGEGSSNQQIYSA